MRAPAAARPGLLETLLVWAMFASVALAILVTYARLPLADLYNVDEEGLKRGAGRALVFAGFPTALAAVALLGLVADRLRTRATAVAAVLAAALCLTVVWPGVVSQSDLDAKPVNALAGIGVLVALGLTALALARAGLGETRPFGRADLVRAVLAGLLVVASIPWIAADLGVFFDGIPGPGRLFLTDEPSPEPGHPDLVAVHLGHHHGLDGTLLALTALALSRPLAQVRGRRLRAALTLYLSLMLAYGLANAVQDLWLEQLVKRGTIEHAIPSLTVPAATPAWAALVAAALAIYFVWRRVGTVETSPPKGAA